MWEPPPCGDSGCCRGPVAGRGEAGRSSPVARLAGVTAPGYRGGHTLPGFADSAGATGLARITTHSAPAQSAKQQKACPSDTSPRGAGAPASTGAPRRQEPRGGRADYCHVTPAPRTVPGATWLPACLRRGSNRPRACGCRRARRSGRTAVRTAAPGSGAGARASRSGASHQQ